MKNTYDDEKQLHTSGTKNKENLIGVAHTETQ